MVVSMRRLVLRLSLSVLLFSFFIASQAHADILFEGYAKVMLSGEHVGYAVQRYEFDSKKQEFKTTSFLRTNPQGGNITESLIARSSASLKPIAYQYTGLAGGTGKTIDATFKNDEITATVREGGKQQTIKRKIPKGAFLSSFLAYLMLQGKEGIKPGVKYGYQAIAEEDGGLYAGEAFVEKEEAMFGVTTFKVLNTFKGVRFVSNVTHKGEIIATRSPVQQIATELVANMNEATAGMSFNSNSVSVLFGSVPKGTENALARKKSGDAPGTAPVAATTSAAPTASTATETAPAKTKDQILHATPTPSTESPKTEGVAPGQGIVIKGAPPASPPPQQKADQKK